jgi:uncharacterized protein YqjF (DUF2071 family)
MVSEPGEPLLIADWLNVLMIHFAVEPRVLQSVVPFELDLLDGQAYISLVAFDMVGMRFRRGGSLGKWLPKPIATHPFLNVRTYVRCNDEVGIYFLTEWLPNPLSVALGPSLFGLPYRRGRIVRDSKNRGLSTLLVEDCNSDARLLCNTSENSSQPLGQCEPGSIEEWLMERYTAFTCVGAKKRFFRVWHQPWEQGAVEAQVFDYTLLENNWSLFKSAHCVGANFSPGVRGVWMGRPRRLICLEPCNGRG